MSIILKNPHSVIAALKSRPKEVEKIHLSMGDRSEGDAWAQVEKLARENRVTVAGMPKGSGPGGRTHSPGGDKSGRVSGAEAIVRERAPMPLGELLGQAGKDNPQQRGLWLALDCLQDPHNVGAIFRSAAFFGVKGIILTADRSAPLTGTVYDVASGGMESVPFAVETNLQRTLQACKDAGLWVLGTSEHAKENLFGLKNDRAWLAVIGNEEKGMRRLTEENCDMLCAIPPVAGAGVTSLNAAVAAGIVISRLSGR